MKLFKRQSTEKYMFMFSFYTVPVFHGNSDNSIEYQNQITKVQRILDINNFNFIMD